MPPGHNVGTGEAEVVDSAVLDDDSVVELRLVVESSTSVVYSEIIDSGTLEVRLVSISELRELERVLELSPATDVMDIDVDVGPSPVVLEKISEELDVAASELLETPP